MPNAQALSFLVELRNHVGLSQADMARRCGLRGRQSHQTAGAWERGEITPSASRRTPFIGYLWDDLGVRRDPARFEEIWDVLADEWGWDPIDDGEWRSFTSQPRPSWNAIDEDRDQNGRPPFQALARAHHFVGRADERRRIADRLRAQPAVPLALVGMGGVGKTTLAAQMAHDLRADFPDGVLWGSPAQSDPAAILDSWAGALGLDLNRLPDAASKAASVRDLLSDSRTLIVLDDVPAAAVGDQSITVLLPAAPACAVLITTRSADVAHALHADVLALSSLHEDESATLLARVLGPERTGAEPESARRLCALLDHLPLAVEIAGQRLRARPERSIADFVRRLQSVQSLLTELRVSDRAVRTSFETSWQGLDGPLQRTFARLALFGARPFAVDAVAYLCDLDEYDAEEHLFGLAALSLLGRAREGFHLHPLLAQFAAEKLAERDDGHSARTRFARYFSLFAQQHAAILAVDDPAWTHIDRGMETAHQLGSFDLVIDYATALALPWRRQGHFARARRGYRLAVEAAAILDRPQTRADFLSDWGFAALEQDDYDAADDLLRRAQAAWEEMGEAVQAAEALLLRARICVEQDDYDAAEAMLTECWDVFSEWDESSGLARTLYWRGLVQYYQGNFDTATALQKEALGLQETIAVDTDRIATLRILGDLAIEANNPDAAADYGERALTLAQQLVNQPEEAAARYLLAVAADRQGHWDQAEEHAQIALDLFQRIGDRGFQATLHFQISQIHFRRADYAAAEQAALRSQRMLHEEGQGLLRLYLLLHRARICASTQRRQQAIDLLQTAQRHARHHGLPQIELVETMLTEVQDDFLS